MKYSKKKETYFEDVNMLKQEIMYKYEVNRATMHAYRGVSGLVT